MKLLEYVVGVLAPHQCVGCGAEGRVICATCSTQLPAVPSRCYRCLQPTSNAAVCTTCRPRSALQSVWAVTPYTGTAKQVIHALKFERAQAAAQDVARTIVAALPQGTAWVVTHVPTATSRVRARGYDQARLIAQAVAKQSDCAYTPLLVRQGQTRQVGHGRADRQQQLRGQYAVRHTTNLHNKVLLLIDDVLTTGATLEACAVALRQAGARSVSAAVFAAAERPSDSTP